jgi:hypothetical protein
LPSANNYKYITSTVSPTTADLTLNYVGALSSLNQYLIGFKIAFAGNELLDFTSNIIFSITVTDFTTGAVVVKKTAPPAVQSSYQALTTNTWHYAAGTNPRTQFHSLLSTQTLAADYTSLMTTTWGITTQTQSGV